MATIRRFLQDPDGHYFLFGPRGTGKSTWLGMVHPDALVVDLLAPELERRYAARPERLRELVAGHSEAKVVVVDEVQKVPALLDVVHQLIETAPTPRFVLTGSSARKLKRAGVDLLAGRAILRSRSRIRLGTTAWRSSGCATPCRSRSRSCASPGTRRTAAGPLGDRGSLGAHCAP